MFQFPIEMFQTPVFYNDPIVWDELLSYLGECNVSEFQGNEIAIVSCSSHWDIDVDVSFYYLLAWWLFNDDKSELSLCAFGIF